MRHERRIRLVLQSAAGVRREVYVRASSVAAAIKRATHELAETDPTQYGWLPVDIG